MSGGHQRITSAVQVQEAVRTLNREIWIQRRGIGVRRSPQRPTLERGGCRALCSDLRPPMTNTSHAAEGHGSLLMLALLALIVGAAAGLVGAIFRLTLEQADRLRDALIAWAQGEKVAGFLIVVMTCAAAAFIAAWLVRRNRRDVLF